MTDSKSVDSDIVWVRPPPSAPKENPVKRRDFLLYFQNILKSSSLLNFSSAFIPATLFPFLSSAGE